MNNSKWFVKPRPVQNPKLRLFCFPYAGGNAATFIPWKNYLPSWVELVAVQPPGRSNRMFEAPYHDMDALVADLLSHFRQLVDTPFIFFGHSLGSRVAYELAKRCQMAGLPLPQHFIASGSRAPFASSREKPIYNLPNEGFLEELKSLNGTPKEVLDNKELMSMLLPLLRADFQISDDYCSTKEVIDTKVTVLGGDADAEITESDLASWGEVFSHLESVNVISGGHFFIESNSVAALKIINSVINSEYENISTLPTARTLATA